MGTKQAFLSRRKEMNLTFIFLPARMPSGMPFNISEREVPWKMVVNHRTCFSRPL